MLRNVEFLVDLFKVIKLSCMENNYSPLLSDSKEQCAATVLVLYKLTAIASQIYQLIQ